MRSFGSALVALSWLPAPCASDAAWLHRAAAQNAEGLHRRAGPRAHRATRLDVAAAAPTQAPGEPPGMLLDRLRRRSAPTRRSFGNFQERIQRQCALAGRVAVAGRILAVRRVARPRHGSAAVWVTQVAVSVELVDSARCRSRQPPERC